MRSTPSSPSWRWLALVRWVVAALVLALAPMPARAATTVLDTVVLVAEARPAANGVEAPALLPQARVRRVAPRPPTPSHGLGPAEGQSFPNGADRDPRAPKAPRFVLYCALLR